MITAIIQARVGSTRLPGKVFLDLAGKPLIWHICERVKQSKYIDKIILATTKNNKDDKLVRWAIDNKIDFFRGSEEDVLSRFYFAAKESGSSIIVRITADDPFKDANIIDNVIRMLISENLDFAFNNNPPSFPEGLDTEVFTFEALQKAFENAKDSFEREHVTQYFYRNISLFKMKNFSYKRDISYLRWTIDRKEDYLMAKAIYEKLYKSGEIFWFEDILDLLKKHPEISLLNNNVERSTMYLK